MAIKSASQEPAQFKGQQWHIWAISQVSLGSNRQACAFHVDVKVCKKLLHISSLIQEQEAKIESTKAKFIHITTMYLSWKSP